MQIFQFLSLKVGIDYSAAAMNILMTPRQLHLVIDALSSIDSGISHSLFSKFIMALTGFSSKVLKKIDVLVIFVK